MTASAASLAKFAPLLRRVLHRSLAKALDEDRRDLESGTYEDDRAG